MVPAYFHPAVAAGDWDRLAAAGAGAGWVIVNTADGPGARTEPDYVREIARLQTSGVSLLGYVDTDYTRRDPAAVLLDANRWEHLYGVRNLFCDRISGDAASFSHESGLAAALRRGGVATLALNPGRAVDPRYTAIADILVTFEGPWSLYREPAPAPPHSAGSRAAIAHLVHAVPDHQVTLVATLAAARGATFSYASGLTGANPWGALSSLVS